MVCRPHSFLGPPLKGRFLCLLVLATRKRVNVLLDAHLVGYLIFLELVFDILLYLLFVPAYCVHEIPSGPEMSVAVLLLEICIAVEYH